MGQVTLYTTLLTLGLVCSQFMGLLGDALPTTRLVLIFITLVCLAYIMTYVGFDFQIDKTNVRQYGWDYIVAMTAATIPWILCAIYFLYFLFPDFSWHSISEALLGARFTSPTSAGVLFSMLTAAGLSRTWMFKKARILAIFDDLDTVLLMIPLQMLIIGFKSELLLIIVIMGAFLWMAWKYLNKLHIPSSWPWVLFYAILISGFSKSVYLITKSMENVATIHFEVLLPAFVLGCMIGRLDGEPRTNMERKVNIGIGAVFMFLVGISMPSMTEAGISFAEIEPWTLGIHVLIITILSNIGKLFPALCYRKEASWRDRLAVAIAMFPRGEVGAGVLVISLSYGINKFAIAVASLSMALNLLLTGVFIWIVKRLITSNPPEVPVDA